MICIFQEFFPDADILVKYLSDFATKLRLNLLLNTEVRDILKQKDGIFHMNDNFGNQFICKYVIVATGISVPNKANITGQYWYK